METATSSTEQSLQSLEGKTEVVDELPPVPPPRRESLMHKDKTVHRPEASRRHGVVDASRPLSVRKEGDTKPYRSLPQKPYSQHDFKNIGQRTRKQILLVLLLLLLIIGLVLLLYFLWPLFLGSSECSNNELSPEYRSIVCSRLRARKTCEFDPQACAIQCPLGLETDEYACIVSCNCATRGLFESDVFYDKNSLQTVLSAYMTEEDHNFQLYSGSATSILSLWNNHDKIGTSVRIPYVLSPDLDPSIVHNIIEAIVAFSNQTCIEFVLRADEEDYLNFKSGLGCWSSVGRVGGEQVISLSKYCNSIGSIMHEMMHALGFWHEHSRPDRNKHIMVMWENIDAINQHQFNTRSYDTIFDFNSPYDISSVMHGSGYSFSKVPTVPSMVDLQTNEAVRIQRDGISTEDIFEINALYECTVLDPNSASGVHWSSWSSLGLCSVTCGSGVAYQLRECVDRNNDIVPRRFCGTEYHQEQLCDMLPCEQGLWGPWSPCDHTCGLGIRKRISCCGKDAITDTENCNRGPCTEPAATFWSEWQEWGECIRTCGNGMRRRYRACFDMFQTKVENLRCPQIEVCATNPCPDTVHEAGNWGVWSQWGDCSRTCGMGSKERYRACLTMNATKANHCIGDNTEVDFCNKMECPKYVLALWAPWGPWSGCTDTCGGGTRSRVRHCQSAEKLTPENDCGDSTELIHTETKRETCNNEPCEPEIVMWAEWKSWGDCNKNCGGGTRWRLRLCHGKPIGNPRCPWDGVYDTQSCNEDSCETTQRSPENGYAAPRAMSSQTSVRRDTANTKSVWGPWFRWRKCSASCGGGWTTRYRLCENTNKESDKMMAYDCRAEYNKTSSRQNDKKQCNTQACRDPSSDWLEWEPWSACTASCGRGFRKRKRGCKNRRQCQGDYLDSDGCYSAPCEDTETGRKPKSGIFASGKLADFFGGATSAKPPVIEKSLKADLRHRKNSFCDKNSRLYLADFDGDAKKDMLCLDRGGKVKIAYAANLGSRAQSDWQNDLNFCSGSLSSVYAVDFDGDGMDDLMCFKKETGTFTVLFAKDGQFDREGRVTTGQVTKDFCMSFAQMLHVTDINQDGKGDLVCSDGAEEDVLITE